MVYVLYLQLYFKQDSSMAISGLVITFNEEKNIEKCVKELFQVCDEVIVIDSNSSDRTVEIAKENGAKVFL